MISTTIGTQIHMVNAMTIDTIRQCLVMVMCILVSYGVYRVGRGSVSPFIVITNILLLIAVIVYDKRYQIFTHLPYTRWIVIYTLVFTNVVGIGELIIDRRMVYDAYHHG